MYFIKKIAHPLRGLYIATTSDRGFQIQLAFFAITLPILYTVFKPFTTIESVFLLIGYGFLLITELQNTALERALDRIHPERHEGIRDSKDIAASSVLMSLCILSGIVLFFALERGMI